MASIINQLARKKTPSLRIIASSIKTPLLFNPVLPSTKPAFLNNLFPLCDSNAIATNPIPQNPTKPLHLYFPNFPFVYCLNPCSITDFDQWKAFGADSDGNYTDHARKVWADSVKKKRKKKMNKHKYKKLRKRLNRKA